MLKVLRIFKPTFFSFFIFVILILVQLIFTTSSGSGSFGYEGEMHISRSRTEFGIKPVVIVEHERGKTYPSLPDDVRATMSREEYEDLAETEEITYVEIKWGPLFLNLGLCYILATVFSKINKIIKIRRPTLVYVLATFCICLIAFIASIIIWKNMWGYYLHRPKVIRSLNDILEVKAVIPVKTGTGTSGERNIIVDAEYQIPKDLSQGRDDYYCLQERVLIFLSDNNLLPENLTLDLADLTELHSLIAQTGILIEADEGYDDSDLLRGIVVDGLDEKGERLVIAGVRGRQVSNDHFPYYEIAFKGKQRDDLVFISGQHFFYDVAGLEGVEWEAFFIYFSLFSVPAGLVGFTVILILWRLIQYCYGRYSARRGKDEQGLPDSNSVSV